jgi:hypothetical protein
MREHEGTAERDHLASGRAHREQRRVERTPLSDPGRPIRLGGLLDPRGSHKSVLLGPASGPPRSLLADAIEPHVVRSILVEGARVELHR